MVLLLYIWLFLCCSRAWHAGGNLHIPVIPAGWVSIIKTLALAQPETASARGLSPFPQTILSGLGEGGSGEIPRIPSSCVRPGGRKPKGLGDFSHLLSVLSPPKENSARRERGEGALKISTPEQLF